MCEKCFKKKQTNKQKKTNNKTAQLIERHTVSCEGETYFAITYNRGTSSQAENSAHERMKLKRARQKIRE